MFTAGLLNYNRYRSNWKSRLFAKVQKKIRSWFDSGRKKKLYHPPVGCLNDIKSIAIGAGIVTLSNLVPWGFDSKPPSRIAMPLITLAAGWYSYTVHNRLASSVVKRTLSVSEVYGLIPGLVKSNTVSQTARHCFNVCVELCCPGAKQRRWAPPRYTLRRNTVSIMKI